MIDASFIKRIEELSVPTIFPVGDRQFSSKSLTVIKPASPDSLTTSTLTSIVKYFKSFNNPENYLIHVKGPSEVYIASLLDPAYQTRKIELSAECLMDEFPFGRKMDVEQFIIALQAQFVQDDTTAAILRLVGNITAKAEQSTLDDGVTQTITAKTGITRVENTAVPNPVTLRPRRTFIEVEQPASMFVFRMSALPGEKPTCALHEADGGAWKNAAVKNIANFLEFELPDASILA